MQRISIATARLPLVATAAAFCGGAMNVPQLVAIHWLRCPPEAAISREPHR